MMNSFSLVKINIDDFECFYKLLEDSFPNDERRKYENQKRLFSEEKYSVWGYKNEHGLVVAFIAFWKFENFNYIEHFAVSSELRCNGLGTQLIRQYLKFFNETTILEVELPNDQISIRRINFYKRMGFVLNDYDYVQPPMQEESSFLPLKIMSYNNYIDFEDFDEIKDYLYKYVYKYKSEI